MKIFKNLYDSTQQKIYGAVNYPGELAHIAAIDLQTGDMKKICDVPTPTPTLYYVTSLVV